MIRCPPLFNLRRVIRAVFTSSLPPQRHGIADHSYFGKLPLTDFDRMLMRLATR